MAKGLTLKVRKFVGLIPTFIEFTEKKLVEVFLAPHPPPQVSNNKQTAISFCSYQQIYLLVW